MVPLACLAATPGMSGRFRTAVTATGTGGWVPQGRPRDVRIAGATRQHRGCVPAKPSPVAADDPRAGEGPGRREQLADRKRHRHRPRRGTVARQSGAPRHHPALGDRAVAVVSALHFRYAGSLGEARSGDAGPSARRSGALGRVCADPGLLLAGGGAECAQHPGEGEAERRGGRVARG